MKRLLKFIKEWASAMFFAVVLALLLCALIVCVAQIAAKIGVFMASCGLVGSVIAIVIFANELVYEIKSRKVKSGNVTNWQNKNI